MSSFFKWFSRLLAASGFLLLLSSFVFLVYLVVGYEHSPISVSLDTFLHYDEHKIDQFEGYRQGNTIHLNVRFLEEQTKNYYLMYGYYYFDTYKEAISLVTSDPSSSYFITINLDGVASILD